MLKPNLVLIILVFNVVGLADLFAQEFLYLRNVPSCRIKAYHNKRLEPVYDDSLFNTPIDMSQFERHPTFVRFGVNEKIYIASTTCVFLAEGENSLKETVVTEDMYTEGFIDNNENAGPFKLFSMFTISRGTFEEKLFSSTGGLRSEQNSPFTLGLGGNYQVNKNGTMLAGSIYSSFLKTATVTNDAGTSAQSSSMPNEIGANLYLQNNIKELEIAPYGGFDYEKFTTFNTTEYVQQDAALALNSNSMFFATIGLSKTFYLGKHPLTTKVSFAKVFDSVSSAGFGKEYYGQRILFFASIHGTNKLSYNFLYKRHNLSGGTNLTVDRFGLGLSYKLF